MASNEILIETRKFGNLIKVTAIDVTTGTEVVFQAPASASATQIKSLATGKMRYVLNKTQSQG